MQQGGAGRQPGRAGRPLHIGIKTNQLNPRIASVWYRALYPALQLIRRGHRVTLFERRPSLARLAGLDALVIVKPSFAHDLRMASAARSAGLPLLVDLCDDTLQPGYGEPTGREQSIARAVIGMSHAVVTTGPLLAARLRSVLPPDAEVVEIPDPIETEEDNRAILRTFRLPLARAAMRRSLAGVMPRAVRQQVAPRLQLLRTFFGKVPVAEWPRRLPAAAMRRFRRRLGVPAGPAAGSADEAETAPPLAAARTPPPRLPPLPVFTDLPPAMEPAPGQARRTVLWFGIHGAPYADFGIRNLAIVAPHLARVAAEMPLRLLVVSSSRAEFHRVTRGWPFPCEYAEWSREAIFGHLDAADVCIVPNSRDAFSIVKSANRAVLALSRGLPVVATDTPAMAPLAPYIALDDWEGALRRCLADPDAARRQAAAGRDFVFAHFGGAQMATAWEALLYRVGQARPQAAEAGGGIGVLAVLALPQDLDVLLPVLLRLRDDPRFRLSVCLTERLAGISARTLQALVGCGLMPEVVGEDEVLAGAQPRLDRAAVLLTASETSHRAHRTLHALVGRANGVGLETFTFQHGLENVGLTYFDPEDEPTGPVRFASRHVLLWGPAEALPAAVPAETRARCRGVGITKPARAPRAALPLPVHAGPVVAVFENLHWSRYQPAYRLAFLTDLMAAAEARPETLFLVKPHHAGRWLARSAKDNLRAPPANLLVADPALAEWQPFTASAIIESVDAVITTPSTVALDAARAGRGVAVAAYGMDLPVYAPLPLLQGVEDWLRFLDAPASGVALDRFVDRHVLPGDAVGRVLEAIAEAVRPAAALGEEGSPIPRARARA